MKELFILIAHLLTTLVKLARPGGVRAITKAATSNRLSGPLFDTLHLSTSDYERARKAAPGWDIYSLESEWREWIATKGQPEKPGPAFIAFCRKKYQREGRP